MAHKLCIGNFGFVCPSFSDVLALSLPFVLPDFFCRLNFTLRALLNGYFILFQFKSNLPSLITFRWSGGISTTALNGPVPLSI